MTITLTGATRLNVIVGDPIAQVKSPGGMTAAFVARGHDGIVVPVQSSSTGRSAMVAMVTAMSCALTARPTMPALGLTASP